MNIRTSLFHMSIWRDGWVYFGLLPDYRSAGFARRNCPPSRWSFERVPVKSGSTLWIVGPSNG